MMGITAVAFANLGEVEVRNELISPPKFGDLFAGWLVSIETGIDQDHRQFLSPATMHIHGEEP